MILVTFSIRDSTLTKNYYTVCGITVNCCGPNGFVGCPTADLLMHQLDSFCTFTFC